MSRYGGFAPYVPVAERKRKAAKEVERLKKKGTHCEPIVISGRTIANTFWGKAWCKNLEDYSDYSNRLLRGRTYARNGSVIDLKVDAGEIMALVSGSSIYKVKITIAKVMTEKWRNIVDECSGKIDSLIELLQGKFSKAVMQVMTDPHKGLFPHPKEIKLSCSCPDWADMCKHVAAVLYGVGARLDDKPEELFMLRQADHIDLITQVGVTTLTMAADDPSEQMIKDSDLSSLFGIDIDDVSEKEEALVSKVRKKKSATILSSSKKNPVKTPPAMKEKNEKIAKTKAVVKIKKTVSKSKEKTPAASKTISKKTKPPKQSKIIEKQPNRKKLL